MQCHSIQQVKPHRETRGRQFNCGDAALSRVHLSRRGLGTKGLYRLRTSGLSFRTIPSHSTQACAANSFPLACAPICNSASIPLRLSSHQSASERSRQLGCPIPCNSADLAARTILATNCVLFPFSCIARSFAEEGMKCSNNCFVRRYPIKWSPTFVKGTRNMARRTSARSCGGS